MWCNRCKREYGVPYWSKECPSCYSTNIVLTARAAYVPVKSHFRPHASSFQHFYREEPEDEAPPVDEVLEEYRSMSMLDAMGPSSSSSSSSPSPPPPIPSGRLYQLKWSGRRGGPATYCQSRGRGYCEIIPSIDDDDDDDEEDDYDDDEEDDDYRSRGYRSNTSSSFFPRLPPSADWGLAAVMARSIEEKAANDRIIEEAQLPPPLREPSIRMAPSGRVVAVDNRLSEAAYATAYRGVEDEEMARALCASMDTTQPQALNPASRQAVGKLTKKTHVGPSMGECSICMDAIDAGHSITSLPCHHTFHGRCIATWLKRQSTCPICRKSI